MTRSTATEIQHGAHCEPAEGWHVEEWPAVGTPVAVPDRVVRRYPVRD